MAKNELILRLHRKDIRIEKPQVADSPEAFTSSLSQHIRGHTEKLEKIAVEMYTKGLIQEEILRSS